MLITAYPPFRRVIGTDVLEIDLPDGTLLRNVLAWLAERYPAFGPIAKSPSDEFLWQHLIVHVDDQIAGLDTRLAADARLELLPTIAGGSAPLTEIVTHAVRARRSRRVRPFDP